MEKVIQAYFGNPRTLENGQIKFQEQTVREMSGPIDGVLEALGPITITPEALAWLGQTGPGDGVTQPVANLYIEIRVAGEVQPASD